MTLLLKNLSYGRQHFCTALPHSFWGSFSITGFDRFASLMRGLSTYGWDEYEATVLSSESRLLTSDDRIS